MRANQVSAGDWGKEDEEEVFPYPAFASFLR